MTPEPDFELGIPVPRKRMDGPAETAKSVVEMAEPELRPGENDLGRPRQTPRELHPLTDAERKQIQAEELERAARDLAEAEELLVSDPTLGWAGWFAHPLAVAMLLGSMGVLGLFLTSQTLSILGSLASQPPALMTLGYTVLTVLAGLILVAVGRLGLLYWRLTRNRQIRLEGLAELSQRTRLRWLVNARTQEARKQLELYLQGYPLQPGGIRTGHPLKKLGITEESESDLIRQRENLLDPARFSSSSEWFEQFRQSFQRKLDAAAEARIRYWSNRAWVVTALAPNGLYDSLATTYFGFAMITDLCQIYNLRAGRTGTAVLLGRVFFNAYLAGQVGDWEKLAEDQYDQLFLEACQIAGVGVGANVVGKVLGKVGAKATTGYLNRVLLLRLGMYTCRLLRPVA